MARTKPTKQKTNNGANVGYEAELWQMADALRGALLLKAISGEIRTKEAERPADVAID